MAFLVQDTPKPITLINFNSSTSATVNTWTLAISANPLRKSWRIINPTGSGVVMEVGQDDGLGNVTRYFSLVAGETITQVDWLTTGSLFIRNITSSAAIAYIANEGI